MSTRLECSQANQQFSTCSTLPFSQCRGGHSKHSKGIDCLESQCWSSTSGTNTTCPPSPTSCCNKPPGLSEPIYNRIAPHSSSLPLCNSLHILPGTLWAGDSLFMLHGESKEPANCFKKRDSKKPNDNEVPGFSVASLGRTSRWQRNHPPIADAKRGFSFVFLLC